MASRHQRALYRDDGPNAVDSETTEMVSKTTLTGTMITTVFQTCTTQMMETVSGGSPSQRRIPDSVLSSR